MARPKGALTRAGGKWSEGDFNSFIRSNLRRTSQKWPPISACLKNARVERGLYLCNGCKEIVPASIVNEKGRRVKNVHVDHIVPVVDPAVGFESWDRWVERMFVEEDGLQLLCSECHSKKTDEEKALAKERRSNEIP